MMPLNPNQTIEKSVQRSRLARLIVALLPIIVLVLGIGLSWYVYWQQQQLTDANGRARFEREIERSEAAINTRVSAYEYLLYSMNAFIDANASLNHNQWHEFVNTLELDQRYPGVVGVGYAAVVPAPQLSAFEKLIQGEGVPDYRVRSAGTRDIYYPVQYIEPLERNQQALGFDLGAEPAERAAAEHARDSGSPTLSSKLTLEQGQTGEAGFMLIVPIYRHNVPLDTIEQRREALMGWVFAPIRASAAMQGILDADPPEVELEIFDGNEISSGNLLYNSGTQSMPAKYESVYKQKLTITVGERPWTLGFASEPAFDVTLNRNEPLFILAGGVITSLLLGGITVLLLNTRRIAIERAERMTLAVRQNEARLRSQNQFLAALQTTRLGVLRKQPLDALLQSIVERASELTGASHGYLFQLDPNQEEMAMNVGVGFFKQRVGDRIRPGQSVAGVAWQTGRPLVVNDYPRWTGRVPNPVFDNLSSLAGVPLKSGDKVVGVIGLGHLKGETVRFSEDDIDRLTQIGEMASLALDNAQLFDTAQQELTERARAEEELRTAHDELEMRVQERTVELRASEEAITQAQKFLDSIVENIPNMVFVKDAQDLRFVRFNKAGEELLGFAQRDLLGKNDYDFFPKEEADFFTAKDREVLDGKQLLDIAEEPIQTTNHGQRVLHTKKIPLLDDAGIPKYLLGISEDITERKQAEEALRRQNEYLAALQDTTVGLIGRLDLNDLFKDIIMRAGALVGTEHGYLYLPEPNEQEMQMRVGTGVQTEFVGNRITRGEGLAGRVWQSGQPLVVNDYPIWPSRLHAVNPTLLRAVAGVPLKSGDHVVGVLGLSYLEAGKRFSEREVEVLQRFAQLASIALDNARLFEQTQRAMSEVMRRNEELSVLNEVGQALSHLAEPDEILQLIYGMIGRVLDNRNVYIALYDAEKNRLSFPIYYVDGQPRQTQTRPLGTGLTEHVIRSRQMLLLSHDVDETLTQLGVAKVGSSTKSLLVTPMIAGQKVIGVIAMQDYEHEGVYTEEKASVLNTIASQAAIAIENARLFKQTQAALSQTQRLAEREKLLGAIADRLHRSTDLQNIMRTAAEELRRATGSTRAVVRLNRENVRERQHDNE